ncbi:MAG TPA: MFS transporter [Gammaproteobacteria bacterium]|nr:MFS transporter [Gammaproteobacteria bacterium]
MNIRQSSQINKWYPLLVISLCAFFLFYKYVLQIYPSIITDQLMQEFKLTGAGLGNLAATFYYTYMIAQLIVGVLLDKYNTRWLTAGAIFSCAAGVFLFAHADNILFACLSRGLMGIGVAFATVAYMKLAAMWFPPRQYAFIGGLLATAAMAGAVFGQAPLAFIVSQTGWRACLAGTGIIGFILAFLFALVVRDKPALPNKTTTSHPVSLSEIVEVFKNKQNWLLTFYSGLAFSPVVIFGGLWGNPFVVQAYEVSKTEAATLVSIVFIGLGIGSPILGFISDRLGNRRNVLLISTFIAFIAITLVLYAHPMPVWLLGTLLFIFGFFLGAFMLVFAIGKELNKPALTGTVIAMINMSDAILDAITEPGIGKLLDLNWNGKIVNGVHYFSLSTYHLALSVLPAYLLVATVILFWVKDRPFQR